jgi:hypothetical protein
VVSYPSPQLAQPCCARYWMDPSQVVLCHFRGPMMWVRQSVVKAAWCLLFRWLIVVVSPASAILCLKASASPLMVAGPKYVTLMRPARWLLGLNGSGWTRTRSTIVPSCLPIVFHRSQCGCRSCANVMLGHSSDLGRVPQTVVVLMCRRQFAHWSRAVLGGFGGGRPCGLLVGGCCRGPGWCGMGCLIGAAVWLVVLHVRHLWPAHFVSSSPTWPHW